MSDNTEPLYINNDLKYRQWSYIPEIMDHLVLKDFEERMKRMTACKGCSSLSSDNICNECACEAPAKTWVPWEKCPLGKW